MCRIRDNKKFKYFLIFVNTIIFYESFQFGIGMFQSKMLLYLADYLP